MDKLEEIELDHHMSWRFKGVTWNTPEGTGLYGSCTMFLSKGIFYICGDLPDYVSYKHCTDFELGDVVDIKLSEGDPKMVDAVLFGAAGGLVGGRINIDIELRDDYSVILNCGARTDMARVAALEELRSLKETCKTSATSDTKNCPYCAETIKAKAVVCRYCGKDLVEEPTRQPAQPTTAKSSPKIKRDIVIGGQTAFQEGEAVVVEAVSPDPNRPEYKYVITSRTLNKKFRLSDSDVDTG